MCVLSFFLAYVRTEGRGSWGSTGVHNHDDAEMDKDWRREPHITATDRDGDATKPMMWENSEPGNRNDDDEHTREDADNHMDTGATAEAENEVQGSDGNVSDKSGE